MKNRVYFLTISTTAVGVVLGAYLLSSFTSPVSQATHLGDFSATFNTQLIALDRIATAFSYDKTTPEELQHTLSTTRLAYKKIEFYVAFRYPEYAKEHVNGAPLLHLDQSGVQPIVLEPEGLQILDELIFSEEAAAEKFKIASLAKKLRNSYGALHAVPTTEIRQEDYLTAMRMQLVRIFTLGLTGFDTPGSLQALVEARASLAGMQQVVEHDFRPWKPAERTAVARLFEAAGAALDTVASFDEFDRLTFLTVHLDPLYEALGRRASADGPDDLSQVSAWNARSTSLFSADFLNPYFFAELTPEEDRPAVRALGKKLFFDPSISQSQRLSCASCHQPERAFSDGIPKSLSNRAGKTVRRNAPGLLNAGYADRYFYDLRAFSLEQQAEHVIFDSSEFNTAYAAILRKLRENPEYAQDFNAAFGQDSITRPHVSKALASYVLSLRSWDSPVDRYIRGEREDIPTEVKNGFNLFMGKAACATCHFPPTFSGLVPPFYNENESEVLGVPEQSASERPTLDPDRGRGGNEILSEAAWIFDHSFKTTTVRNVAATAPYFHNGAYRTLEEVIDFYDRGGGAGLALNVPNQTLPPDSLHLTEREKEELVAFMEALSDFGKD